MEKEALIKEEKKSFFFSSFFYKIFIIGIVIALSLLVGSMLFGTRSLEVYLKLKKDEKKLRKEVKALEKENEKLLKKIFEYRILMPSEFKNASSSN